MPSAFTTRAIFTFSALAGLVIKPIARARATEVLLIENIFSSSDCLVLVRIARMPPARRRVGIPLDRRRFLASPLCRPHPAPLAGCGRPYRKRRLLCDNGVRSIVLAPRRRVYRPGSINLRYESKADLSPATEGRLLYPLTHPKGRPIPHTEQRCESACAPHQVFSAMVFSSVSIQSFTRRSRGRIVSSKYGKRSGT